MRRGEAPDWPAADGERRADEVLEEDAAANTDAEQAVGLIAPIMAIRSSRTPCARRPGGPATSTRR
jgi:hypothetical protein